MSVVKKKHANTLGIDYCKLIETKVMAEEKLNKWLQVCTTDCSVLCPHYSSEEEFCPYMS